MTYSYYEYKNLKSNKTKGFTIIIIFIILLLGLAVFLQNSKTEYNNFYFVEMGNFNNYNDAQELSNQIKQQQGAGYIFFDTSYHVLANYYSNKNDAEIVCNNLIPSHPNTKVLKLSVKKIKYTQTKNEQQKSLVEFYNNCSKILSNLSKANINYDNGTDSLRIYQTNLSLIKEKLSPKIEDLKTNFNDNKYYTLLTYANNINTNIGKFDDSDFVADKQKVRYSTIDIAINYYNFLSEF